ncbi:DeoR/GlpR family DNA-binding transcription regulator [Anaerocolumna sp. MB42-C2]|uniref:DeoR/GlpR family DNA-binding transcription regulator n=1 Tax=Anaerocolumna sp. MB42-C2 TaxID=3070997 RepID=UPI0027E0EF7C|nr:DeoR/GlpR family DNA-binding transcription regulator [Anaerocolumna sp. MB42-C2]WMJ90250.1 DeoR/GlpR family DNA-binding transcription regulator [Anaerocolumna sp. MB42-C2]
MGKKADRMNRLIDIIKSKNGASVKELASLLGVSEMTIRRDLIVLEQNNIVNNVYGAAIYNPAYKQEQNDSSYELSNAKNTQDLEKSKIGAFAASLIGPGDIVVIDTGSTTEMLAENIDDSLEATILCYNANILNSLRQKENLSLIFSGGRYHPKTQMVESAEGIDLIQSMRFTKAFISAAGIHHNLGVTCVYHYEIPTKKAIMQSSLEKILIMDSTKFGQVKPAYFANLVDFDVIITDSLIPEEWKKEIENLKIKLYMV